MNVECIFIYTVVVWRSGIVKLYRARLLGLLGRVTVSGLNSGAGHLSRYVTSQAGQLSLAIPLWVGALSTDKGR